VRRLCLATLALGLFVGAGRARASGLNVSPVQIWLSPDASKSLVTLRNEGPDAVRYQISASLWDEDAKTGMKLSPTEDIVVFPTVLELKPGEAKGLRVGPVVPFGPLEKTYRIFIDEMPAPQKAETRATVRVLTRVGIPVFVAPTKSFEDHRVSASVGKTGASIDVENTGNVHFRIETVKLEGFSDGGERLFEKQAQGWYVLAGGHKLYQLEIPRAACAKVRKLVVSVKTEKEQAIQEPLATVGGACGS
jgi:fimbrial chaperone protein